MSYSNIVLSSSDKREFDLCRYLLKEHLGSRHFVNEDGLIHVVERSIVSLVGENYDTELK